MPSNLNPIVRIGALATLKIPIKTGAVTTSVLQYHYQNIDPAGPIVAYGKTFNYLPFNAGLPPQRLELDSNQGTIALPTIPAIRDLYNQHSGLVEAIVFVRFRYLDNPGETAPIRKAQVISSDISGAQITLELGTPIGLMDGNVIFQVFEESKFPSIAYNLNIGLG